MPHGRCFACGVAVGAVGLALTGAAVRYLVLIPFESRGAEERLLQCSVQMRAVAQALVTYEQRNGQLPRADDQWKNAVLTTGLVPPEVFEQAEPHTAGVPLFFYRPPSPPVTSNFTRTQVLLVQNPATTGGQGGLVAYNDNHVDHVNEPEFSRLIESFLHNSGARALK